MSPGERERRARACLEIFYMHAVSDTAVWLEALGGSVLWDGSIALAGERDGASGSRRENVRRRFWTLSGALVLQFQQHARSK